MVHISGTVSDTVTGFIYILTYQSIFKLFRSRRANKSQRDKNSAESNPKITLTPSNEFAPSKDQVNTGNSSNDIPVASEMMQSSHGDIRSDDVKEKAVGQDSDPNDFLEGQDSDMRPNSVLEVDARACELFTRYSPGSNIPYNAMQNKNGTLQQIGRQQGDVFCLAYRDAVNYGESSRTTGTKQNKQNKRLPRLKRKKVVPHTR